MRLRIALPGAAGLLLLSTSGVAADSPVPSVAPSPTAAPVGNGWPSIPDLQVGLVILVVIGVIALVILMWYSQRTNASEIKAPGGLSVKRFAPANDLLAQAKAEAREAQAQRDSLALALRQYSEVAEALPAVFEASPGDVEGLARDWFDELATRLANCLKSGGGQLFRAAIWLNDASVPDEFVSVGLTQGAFKVTNGKKDGLAKKRTIGAIAFRSKDGVCYCEDTKTDSRYRPKSARPKYRSIYALALGRSPRWGVMTIDAVRPNAFGDSEIEIVEVFAGLSSVAASIWYAKVSATDETENHAS